MQKEIKKSAPEGVKVISTISFIFTGLMAFLGLFLLKFSESMSKMSPSDLSLIAQQGIPLPSTGNLFSLGVILLILSVFLYYLGRDLLNLKNWARMGVGVISALIAVISLLSVINKNWSNIILLIIGGIITWYLLINKDIKKQFN